MPRHQLKAQLSFKIFLKNAEGKVLVGVMPEGAVNPGFYDFPGGRMEEGEYHEPIEKIIAREVSEEIGGDVRFRLHPVPVAYGRHFATRKDGSEWRVFQIYFEADLLGGEIVNSDEHTELKWIDLASTPLEKHFVSGWLEAVKMYAEVINVNRSRNQDG